MKLTVITQPPVEPITKTQVYEWLRLDTTGSPPTHANDATFDMLIEAAREAVENDTRRSLIQQTIEIQCGRFPVALLRPPFISISQVRYYDGTNVEQSLSASVYQVRQSTIPILGLQDGQSWPDIYYRQDAVTVRYVTGYEGTGSPVDDYRANVPRGLQQACLLHVQLAYDNLKSVDHDILQKAYDRLIERFRIPLV